MQDFSRSLGDTVRVARLEGGYTQKQLADKIDVVNVNEKVSHALMNF